jgi:putative ABC transport system permease protein
MGFDYSDVWVVKYNNTASFANADSLTAFYERVRRAVLTEPFVKEVSFTMGNVPFSQVGRDMGGAEMYDVDDQYKYLLNIQVVKGRWFDKGDAFSRDNPIVISSSLKEKMFGKREALGKLMTLGFLKDRRVIGIVEDIKAKGDYTRPQAAEFSRLDTTSYRDVQDFLVKVAPGTGAVSERQLYKLIAGVMKDANIEIKYLSNERIIRNQAAMVLIVIPLIVGVFLLSNVALGLFGVLWYTINQRRGEIGLRRAVGATGWSISAQLMSEALLLATLSLILGCFFAIQFPLLHVFDLPTGVYVTAIFLSVMFIYTLVLVCSVYTGRQAAGIYPAVALHEE